MPKNNVTDLITDQEMAFARLVLAGTMTDHQAAKAAGLNPDTAAYTKAKPRVRAYMLEHRAAVEQKLVEQEAQELRRQTLRREQVRERVLDRLWELARMNSEMTRGSITSQVKAISMIVAIEGLIPDPRAAKNSASSTHASVDPQPNRALAPQEDDLGQTEPAPALTEDTSPAPTPASAESTFADVPHAAFVPDTRIPFANRHPFFPHR